MYIEIQDVSSVVYCIIALYDVDKKRAIRNEYRVSESSLLWMARLDDGYEAGATADFESHSGRCVIYHDEEDFFHDYRGKAREHHCTPIKSLSQQSYLDQIELTVELHSRDKKTNP